MTVLVISFAATTLDTATRIQRFIIAEIGTTISIRLLQNRYIATILALFPSLILTMWNVQNINTGEITQAGWALWPIFGASNQMLVALTLIVLSLYFFLRKKIGSSIGITFFVYYRYYINCLDFKNSGILGN